MIPLPKSNTARIPESFGCQSMLRGNKSRGGKVVRFSEPLANNQGSAGTSPAVAGGLPCLPGCNVDRQGSRQPSLPLSHGVVGFHQESETKVDQTPLCQVWVKTSLPHRGSFGNKRGGTRG